MNKYLSREPKWTLRFFAAVALICLRQPATSFAAPGDLLRTFPHQVYKLAVHPSDSELYASTDTGVLVINTVTLDVVTEVLTGGAPRGLAVSPDGQTLYVATSGAQQLAVIDLPTYTQLPSITLPSLPFDVAVTGDRIYATPAVTSPAVGIMQVDALTGTYDQHFSLTVSIYKGGHLRAGPGATLYFANAGLSPGTLAKFDVSTNVPALLYKNAHGSLGSNGQDLWLTPDGEYAYYAVGGGNLTGYDIVRIRTSDMTIQGSMLTGAYPREIVTGPDGRTAYAVHTSGHIDVWDTEIQSRIDEYPTVGEASELLTDASGAYLFAAFASELRVYAAEESPPPGIDTDGDLVNDSFDNCLGVPNTLQEDVDSDGIGDACDPFPNLDQEACGNGLTECLDLHEGCSSDLATCQANVAQSASELTTANASLLQCGTNLTECLDLHEGCSSDLATCQANVAQSASELATANASLLQCGTNLTECASELAACSSGADECTTARDLCGTNLDACNDAEQICTSGLAACGAARLDAEALAAVAEADLRVCVVSLNEAIVDSDGDGVPDSRDRCLGSAAAEVDSEGCTQQQFCGRITGDNVRAVCRHSDWKNDEPRMRSSERDCERFRDDSGVDSCIAAGVAP